MFNNSQIFQSKLKLFTCDNYSILILHNCRQISVAKIRNENVNDDWPVTPRGLQDWKHGKGRHFTFVPCPIDIQQKLLLLIILHLFREYCAWLIFRIIYFLILVNLCCIFSWRHKLIYKISKSAIKNESWEVLSFLCSLQKNQVNCC